MLKVVMSVELVNNKERKEKLIAGFESSKYGLLICIKGSFKGFLEASCADRRRHPN